MRKTGFIGAGTMAEAIFGRMFKQDLTAPSQIIGADLNPERLAHLADVYGIHTTTDNKACARESKLLFLSVKPGALYGVIQEIRGEVRPDTVVVSIVAGQSISRIEEAFGRPVKLIRAMPNTPALVGEGMTALTPNDQVTEVEFVAVSTVFDCMGRWETVPESLMDAVTGVSGSSPAYVFLLLEAMADAAVAEGMPREQAYRFAAQAVLGSAKMALETGLHPGALKDQVCSPGGTTIEAVALLEEGGLRSAVIRAQRACTAKSREMGKA